MSNNSLSLIHFNLGPVQKFIESARTSRDLWTGSYLLSWLTASGLAAALGQGATEPEGDVLAETPLVRHRMGKEPGGGLLASCLPNTFIVSFDGDAHDIANGIQKAVEEEWRSICTSVHEMLGGAWREVAADWDGDWDKQVEHFWDIRVTVLPGGVAGDVVRELCDNFGYKAPTEAGNNTDLKRRIFLAGALAAAARRVRHYPAHECEKDWRPKCFQTGVQASMGPMDPADHRKFWSEVLEGDPERTANFRGERLRPQERLGAIALVKRFAWVAHFGKLDGLQGGRRMPDTATVAAAGWLAEPGMEARGKLCSRAFRAGANWSGQWLQAADPAKGSKASEGAGEDDEALICAARKEARKASSKPECIYASQSSPPSYYAILMLDGDGIGNLMREAGTERASQISRATSAFALEDVPRIIRGYLGENDMNQPLYAGGDDVLALLPMIMPAEGKGSYTTVLSCARDIHKAFVERMKQFDGATTSAGIAIAHYKEDLRDVLEAARAAEKAAKGERGLCKAIEGLKVKGRDRLALSAMRRGAEPVTTIVRWEWVELLERLILAFARNEISDRWTYILRQEWETFAGAGTAGGEVACADMIDAEVARLLSRSDKRDPGRLVWNAWEELKQGPKLRLGEEHASGEDPRSPVNLRYNALNLVQTASFIARGKD